MFHRAIESLDPRTLPTGRVVFVDVGHPCSPTENARLYQSREFFNPTLDEILTCCDEALLFMGDFEFIFLKGFLLHDHKNGVQYLRFLVDA